MYSPSVELLHQVSDTSTEKTHMSLFNPRSSHHISDYFLGSFWNNYCELVSNETQNLSLAEIPKQYAPLIVKIEFPFDYLQENNEMEFDDLILSSKIVECYQEVLERNFHLTPDKHELIAVVLGPDSGRWVINGTRKFVVRMEIRFPITKIERGLHNRIIRPNVLQLLRDRRITSCMEKIPSGDWSEWISDSYIEGPIPLYGSVEAENLTPLTINTIFGSRQNVITNGLASPMQSPSSRFIIVENNNPLPIKDLSEVFNPANHSDVLSKKIPSSLFIGHNLHYWAPLFLSIDYWSELTLPISKLNSSLGGLSPPKLINTSLFEDVDPDESEKKMAERFLTMINTNRLEKEHYWLDIGKSLYKVFHGNQHGLELWVRFCSQTEDRSESECRRLYENFDTMNFLSVRTLAWFAREDNPSEYEDWHNKWRATAMENATNCDDIDVAYAFYRTYWLEFIVESMAGIGRWYYFSNHILRYTDNALMVLRTVSNPTIDGNFVSHFESMRTEFSRKGEQSSDKGTKSNCDIMVSKISLLIKKLKSDRGQKKIVEVAKQYFHVEAMYGDNVKFRNIKNKGYAVGTLNGIIQALDTHAVFRPGKPEDFVTKSTPIRFPVDYTWDTPRVKELWTWWNQIFPDPELATFSGKLWGSLLRKGNNDKIFPAHSGMGGNAKSMLKKLTELALGEYSCNFPTTLFTKNASGSGNASPEVAQTEDALVSWLAEPDEEEELKNGNVKKFTGDDSMFARFLHDNGGSMDISVKVFLMCNRIPQILNCDPASIDRFIHVPYLSKWAYDAPDSIEEQYRLRLFKRDPHFNKQLPKLAPAFLWFMFQMYSVYCKEGLAIPQIVKDHTAEYWKHNDMYLIFTNEEIQKVYRKEGEVDVRDTSVFMTTADVWREFKRWFSSVYPNSSCPKRETVIQELNHRWGPNIRGRWGGIMPAQMTSYAQI